MDVIHLIYLIKQVYNWINIKRLSNWRLKFDCFVDLYIYLKHLIICYMYVL
jgi:hypothetical protein